MREKFEYSFPERGCKEQTVSRYALTYQPISAVERNLCVISGIATVTIDMSNAIRKHDIHSPRIRTCSFAPDMKWSPSSWLFVAELSFAISAEMLSHDSRSFSRGGICSFVGEFIAN